MVYVVGLTFQLPSFPSIPSVASDSGGFAAERLVGRRYRSTATGAVQHVRRAAGAQQQMRASSRGQSIEEAEHRLVKTSQYLSST